MVMALAVVMTGCDFFQVPIKSINVSSYENLKMEVGESKQLQPIVTPSASKEKLSFSSSNQQVASVSQSGVLSALKEGESTITVANFFGSIKVSFLLTVSPRVYSTPVVSANLTYQNYGETIQNVVFSVDFGEKPYPSSTANFVWKKQIGKGVVETISISSTLTVIPENVMNFEVNVWVEDTETGLKKSNIVTSGIYKPVVASDILVSNAEKIGWTKVDGINFAKINQKFELALSIGFNIPSGTSIEWYLQKSGQIATKVENQNTGTLQFTFELKSTEQASDIVGNYVVYTVVNGIQNLSQNNFEFQLDYSDVTSVNAKATGYNSKIEMVSYDLKPIVFVPEWNKNETNNSILWLDYYVATVPTTGNYEFLLKKSVACNSQSAELNFEYIPDAKIGISKVKVVAYCKTAGVVNSENAMVKKEVIIDVTVLEQYIAPQKVLATTSSNMLQIGNYQDVVFNASTLPSTNINSQLKFEWFVNGVRQPETGAVFTVSKDYLASNLGETVVQVKFGGVESKMETIYANKTDTFNGYVNSTFVWNGNVYNRYVSSMKEFAIAMNYLTMERVHNLQLMFSIDSGISFATTDELLRHLEVANSFYDEAGIRSVSCAKYTTNNKLGIFTYVDEVTLNQTTGEKTSVPYYPTKVANSSTNKLPQTFAKVAYLSNAGRTSLPIESVDDTYNVTNSNILAKVISWGMKPTFDAVQNETTIQTTARLNAKTIYENACQIMKNIISDSMNEYEKVLAIYDWICCEVEYDSAVLSVVGNVNQQLDYDAYYLEGIFLKSGNQIRRAVCDAKAKAFSLMCGIERIVAPRISGMAGSSGKFGGHAWNKVLIDIDMDGDKEWFLVDSTWGDVGTGTTEILNHAYFLVPDSKIAYDETTNPSGSHIETVYSTANRCPEAVVFQNFVFEDYYPTATTATNAFYERIEYVASSSKLKNTTVSKCDGLIDNAVEMAVAIAYADEFGMAEIKNATNYTWSQLLNMAKNYLNISSNLSTMVFVDTLIVMK